MRISDWSSDVCSSDLSVRTKTHGAQAEGCAPVANAFAAGQDQIQPVKPQTIARSLAIGDPADGRYVLRLARENGGRILAVSDEEKIGRASCRERVCQYV